MKTEDFLLIAAGAAAVYWFLSRGNGTGLSYNPGPGYGAAWDPGRIKSAEDQFAELARAVRGTGYAPI